MATRSVLRIFLELNIFQLSKAISTENQLDINIGMISCLFLLLNIVISLKCEGHNTLPLICSRVNIIMLLKVKTLLRKILILKIYSLTNFCHQIFKPILNLTLSLFLDNSKNKLYVRFKEIVNFLVRVGIGVYSSLH